MHVKFRLFVHKTCNLPHSLQTFQWTAGYFSVFGWKWRQNHFFGGLLNWIGWSSEILVIHTLFIFPFTIHDLFESKSVFDFQYFLSCQWSLSIAPKNIKKSEVFWCFEMGGGIERNQWHDISLQLEN